MAAGGFKIVLLTGLSPVFPFTLLNYAFGLTKVRCRAHVLASWIGMLPGTVMYVYLGSTVKELADVAAGNVEGMPARLVLFFVGLAATVVDTVYVTRVARRAPSGPRGRDGRSFPCLCATKRDDGMSERALARNSTGYTGSWCVVVP